MLQGFSRAIQSVNTLAYITQRFRWKCDILIPDGELGPSGAPSNNWVPVTGLTGLLCTAPPQSTSRILAGEKRSLQEIISKAPKHILLNGYYPGIAAQRLLTDVQVLIYPCNLTSAAAIMHNLLGAESDSQRQMTRMEVELVDV